MKSKPSPRSPNPKANFQRLPLAGQIANNLREAILAGRMTMSLPPERELCEMFHASRPVIRQALHTLKSEGHLRIRRAHRAEIVKQPLHKRKDGKNQQVVFLYTEQQLYLGQWTLMAIDELQRTLHSQGYDFDLVMNNNINRLHPQKQLEKLTQRFQNAHWILGGSSLAMQEWFATQPLRVISMGNAYSNIRIPFVNDDLRAVARHAADVFLSYGHQRIAFLARRVGTAGELNMEGGFLEAFKAKQKVTAQIIRHSGEVEEVTKRLEALFLSKANLVTALLLSHAEDTLVVYHWLLKKGYRVPQDISLISLQWEGYLERLRPMPAWYYTDPKLHARKLCRLILNPWNEKRAPRLIFPAFIKNETLAAPKNISS